MPLFVILSIIVLLGDGRPVFYKGVRLGKGRKPFQMFKFRSLVNNAEKKIGSIIMSNSMANKLKLEHKYGHFLRDTRLDELPQLLNVLLGDMALVGPRPIRPQMYEKYIHQIRDLDLRFLVKPGLIGPSQVFTPHSISHRIRSLLDNRFAMQKSSVFSDLAFLLFVFFRLGSILLASLARKSTKIFFNISQKRQTEERRQLQRRSQNNTVAQIMPKETKSLEMFRMIRISEKLKVINMNAESLLVKTEQPLVGNEVTLRLKKVTSRNGGPVKQRIAYVHGNIQYKSKRQDDNEFFYYVVSYDPISSLNHYKIHQYFLKESIA